MKAIILTLIILSIIFINSCATNKNLEPKWEYFKNEIELSEKILDNPQYFKNILENSNKYNKEYLQIDSNQIQKTIDTLLSIKARNFKISRIVLKYETKKDNDLFIKLFAIIYKNMDSPENALLFAYIYKNEKFYFAGLAYSKENKIDN